MPDTIPFPNGSPGKPVLPPMSVAEREMWMVSHRAPDGMLMIHRTELDRMQEFIQTMSFERAAIVKAMGPLHQGDQPLIRTIQRLLQQLRAAMQEIETLRNPPPADAP